jgi:hypothetical protein
MLDAHAQPTRLQEIPEQRHHTRRTHPAGSTASLCCGMVHTVGIVPRPRDGSVKFKLSRMPPPRLTESYQSAPACFVLIHHSVRELHAVFLLHQLTHVEITTRSPGARQVPRFPHGAGATTEA